MVNLFSPEGISALVQTHGYILLLVLMLIEGPITTYTAAFAASLGLFNIYLVFILSILGNVIPDTILFFIGRLTRTSFVESILETFGMNRSRIKKMEIGLKKHIGKSITLFKLTPGLAIPGLIIAGFTKVSFKRFFIVMLLFNMSSAIMFTLLGFYSGIAASTIFKYFKIGDYILLAMIPLIIFIYWIYKKFLRDYPQENLGKIDKISVIIPAYNEEKNLQTIIRHLRDQSSRNFEIIVVDNNSTDGTFNIAKKLADKACKCKTQGISYARNYGAKKAKSKIIAFLDADSVPVRSWIESINDAFRDRKLSVISGVDLYENKNPAKRFVLNTFSYIIFYYCTALTWFGKPMLIANNMAIKREVFEKAGGFDHFVVEDYYLTIKLGKFGCITKMDGRMKVECSSRRIDKRGLFNTWKVWFVSLFRKIPSGDYALHDKE